MPFLARFPGRIPAGSVNSNLVLNIDFAPTFLELAGLRIPAEMQGRSALSLLQGSPPRDWRESMYYRYYHYPGDHAVQPHYGVRTRRHKLIYFELLNAWELYDLERDPLEMENRANDPAYASVRRRLEGELSRLRREFRDDVVRSPRLESIFGGGRFSPPTNATAVRMTGPFAVQVDRLGVAYVAEMPGNRVLRIATNGWTTVLAGDGEKGDRGDGGPASGARFNGPHSIALAPNGDLYVADTFNHRVRLIEAATGTIRTVAGTGVAGFDGDGGPAVSARFDGIHGIALNDEGTTLFMTDLGNRRIRALNLATGLVRTVAGNGARGVPRDGSPAVLSPLVDPRAVAVDRVGNLYIIERGGNALRMVDRTGRIHTVAGSGEPGGEEAGTAARTARLRGPKDLWVDWDGSVLIADSDNHLIRRYDPHAGTLTRVAGTGLAGAVGLDGPPDVCELNQPHGVWVHPVTGDIYISDSTNHRVLKISRTPPATRQARVNEATPPPRLPSFR